tara:strand:+ start:261 stop:854 length:594 start_codon:yes stop_codon:yes gene_type:complete
MKKTLLSLLLSLLFIIDASSQSYSVNVGLNSTSSSQYWKRSSINAYPGLSFGSSVVFDLSSFTKIKLTSSYFSNSTNLNFGYYYNGLFTENVKIKQNVIKIAPAFHFNLNDDFSIFAGIDYSIPLSITEEYLDSSNSVINSQDFSNFSGTTSVNFGVSYLLYYMFDFELGCSILDYRRQSGSSYLDYNLYFTVGYIL